VQSVSTAAAMTLPVILQLETRPATQFTIADVDPLQRACAPGEHW
jgi:hypothetical protein